MDTSQPYSARSRFCIRLGDMFVTTFCITPLVILFWAGTWKLQDVYLPQPGVVSYSISLGVGICSCILGYFVLDVLKDVMDVGFNAKHMIISRIFIYAFATGTVFYWRGVWGLMDHYLGTTVSEAVVSLLVAWVLKILLQATGNAPGAPLLVLMDTRKDFYQTKPRFRTLPNDNICLHILDILLTVLIILPLTMLTWRGLWNIYGGLLYPDDLFKSYYVCLCIGYIAVWILFSLERPVNKIFQYVSDNLIPALVIENMMHFFEVVAVLFLWRGMLGLFKHFVISAPNEEYESWIAHFVSIGILFVMNCASTIALVGCLVDAEFRQERGLKWPIDYISYFAYQSVHSEYENLDSQSQ